MSLPNDLCALDMLIRAASNSLALFGRNQVGRSVIDLPTQPEVRALSFGTSCVGYN